MSANNKKIYIIHVHIIKEKIVCTVGDIIIFFMDPCQAPVIRDILFASRQRKQMVLFHGRVHKVILDYLSDATGRHSGVKEPLTMEWRLCNMTETSKASVFHFTYDELEKAKDATSPVSTDDISKGPYMPEPYCFLFNHAGYGILMQDVVTCVYYFVGEDRLRELLQRSIDSRVFIPLFSQMLDFQWDKQGYAGLHASHCINWKHFCNWYRHHGDSMSVSKGDRGYCAKACNVFNRGFMWFSETQTSMHATLAAIVVIDFFYTFPAYKESMFSELMKQTEFHSLETIYFYVKYVLEKYTQLPTSGAPGAVKRDNERHQHGDATQLDLASLGTFPSPEDDDFNDKLPAQTRGEYMPTSHPTSLFPFEAPKAYLYELHKIASSREKKTKKPAERCRNPFSLVAVQLAEIIKSLFKAVFSTFLPDGEKYQGMQGEGAVRITKDLKEQVGVSVEVGHYRHIYNTVTNIFNLPRGALSPILRMIFTSRVYVDPYRHEWSHGIGDLALGHALKAKHQPEKREPNAFMYTPCDKIMESEQQYVKYDRSVIGLRVPVQQHRDKQLSIPYTISRIEAGKMAICAKSFSKSSETFDTSIYYIARNFLRVPMKAMQASPAGTSYTSPTDVIIDGAVTHLSPADIAFTLSFYSTRLPFVDRRAVMVSYESDEVTCIALPDFAKERIQRYVPMWLHYMQLTPQNTIMSPILFQNFYLALQNNDIAGMISVAESILNMVSGRQTRVFVGLNRRDNRDGNERTTPTSRSSSSSSSVDDDRFHYSPRMADNFVLHMGLLPLIISSIEYDAAALLPYKNVRSIASLESLQRMDNPKLSDQEADEQCIRNNEYVFQFHPYVPTIYSALRAFICTTEIHTLSLDILDVLTKRFRSQPENNVRYPPQRDFLNYVNGLARYGKNIMRVGSRSHVIIPCYYGRSDGVSRIETPTYDVPLIMHYYPLIYLLSTPQYREREVLDFFLGVRLYSELVPYCMKTQRINEHVEGNYIPPRFAYELGACYADKQRDVMEHYIAGYTSDKTTQLPPYHNLITPMAEGFYDFLTLIELMSHHHAVGMTYSRVLRDLTNAGDPLASPHPHGTSASDVTHSTYRGAVTAWNMLPHIHHLIPFSYFLQFPPQHPIWQEFIHDFHRVASFDTSVFSRTNGKPCSEALIQGDGLKKHVKYPDEEFQHSVNYELFPTFAASVIHEDPTNIRNDAGPFFGSHHFLPFALTFAPIAHMPTCKLSVKQ